MIRRTKWITRLCFLLWFQALMLIALEFVFWDMKPPGNGNWATVSILGLLGIKGGMIACAILLALSAVGIWFMLPLGVILLTAVGGIFFLPQAILAALNFDYAQVSGTEAILGAVSELNCFPLFFAGAILYSLWRRIVFWRL